MTTAGDASAEFGPEELRALLDGVTAMRRGDLDVRLPGDRVGLVGKLFDLVNDVLDDDRRVVADALVTCDAVGKQGRLDRRFAATSGRWGPVVAALNGLLSDLTRQTHESCRVIAAVASGDLSRTMDELVDGRPLAGELLRKARSVNLMVTQLRGVASEVSRVAREVGTEGRLGGQARVPGAAGIWRELTDNVNQLAANLTVQVRAMAEVATAVAQGDLTRSISFEAPGEVGVLKDHVNRMIADLRDTTRKNTEQDWLKTNLARFGRILQGQRDLGAVARLTLGELAPLVGAGHGLFFLMDPEGLADPERGALRLLASYGVRERGGPELVRLGEGLVGQCARERHRILLTEVPADYVPIASGLGEAPPRNVVVLPVVFEGAVRAVLELAAFAPFRDVHLALLDQLTGSIGTVLNTISAGLRTEELLAQSQSLAEELRSQQRELTETNHRLAEQARSLRASEERLRQQQDELQRTNDQLEQRSALLQRQNAEVERQNRQIEQAKLELEERARQLTLSSRYKSEFLANMSHELRTPLNSLLILAQLLAENPDGNLDAKQVEFARTIHGAGTDLMQMIGDILDLAKIESGTMVVDREPVDLAGVRDEVDAGFRHLARAKGLEFAVVLRPDAPRALVTDRRRLQQILKNLLSNAIKFTERGKVELTIEPARDAEDAVAFSVADTGIGIPLDKQKIIFDAFQQADGTTSRKYGGTGLGLSISRELARHLGGELRVRSSPGAGSTFTLYLAQGPAAALAGEDDVALGTSALPAPDAAPPPELRDDRDALRPGDRVLLIVEDDRGFARLLLELARERGLRGVVAARGDTALALARELRPDAITLDLALPGLDGWTVLERLKQDPRTRHIPVHLISGADEAARPRALERGALAFLRKPASREALAEALAAVNAAAERRLRSLLVVEGDAAQRAAIVGLLGDRDDVETTVAGSAAEALTRLREDRFDCAVIDLGLPDMAGLDLIRAVRSDERLRELPIVVYAGQDLDPDERAELERLAEAVIVKGARSAEQLLAEAAQFLRRVDADARPRERQGPGADDPVFAGKRVLVVDDDVRNIFAIASVLERRGMHVLYAEDGRAGLDMLRAHPDTSVVLMDVLMPEMNGYEATRQIRDDPRFAALPIIALTAKAMTGDREKCLEAGASDYITKPVEPDKLLSLLRAWLR